jgi:hypothetical protein
MTIQQQLVKECKTIDKEFNQTRMSKEEYKNKITEIFNRLGVILKQNDSEE